MVLPQSLTYYYIIQHYLLNRPVYLWLPALECKPGEGRTLPVLFAVASSVPGTGLANEECMTRSP